MDEKRQDFLSGAHFDFLQASHADSQRRIFPQLQVVFLRRCLHSRLLSINQVTDILVVDLEERYLDLVLPVHFEVIKHCEYLFHSLVHDTWGVLAAKHSVRLACTCCTVCKDSAVEAIKHTFDQVLCRAIEHLGSVNVAIEGEIECELLLARTVFPELVFTVFFGKVLRILQNHQLFVHYLNEVELPLKDFFR